MKINRNNYAEFFIDFFDGNLNDSDTALLFTFLDANPDIKSEFDAFEMHTLEPDKSSSFANKEELKKPTITLENYQTYLVANLENDLDVHGKQQLDYFIGKNAYVQFDAHLFEKTILNAGVEVFDKKEKLKRPLVIPIYAKYKYQFAVAAAVAMLLLFSQVFFDGNNTQTGTAIITGEKLNTVIGSTEIPNNNLAAAENLNDEQIDNEADSPDIQPSNYSSLASIQKVKIKTVSKVKSGDSSELITGINYVSVENPAFAFVQPESINENDMPVYASVVNEVQNKNTEGQLTQLTNNSLGKLTGNTINTDSKRTKSGLLKSWKLQAGNFAIAHSKN